ncbi:MAG: hypothetical protein AAGB00_06155 [Planctomycetota bacterium]
MRVSVCLFLAVGLPHACAAQDEAVWTGGASGAYDDPANWAPADVPGDGCCGQESAMIQSISGAILILPDNAPVRPHALTVSAASATFVAPSGLGEPSFEVTGQVMLRGGATLTIQDRVSLSAPALMVEGGGPADDKLNFASNSRGDFGVLTVGGTSTGSRDAVVDISAGAEVEAEAINVGSVAHAASLQVDSATLTQTGDASVTVGVPGGATALLVASGGAVVELSGGVEVHGGGRILNTGGEVRFGGDVTLAGGGMSYQESSGAGATRSFAPDATITIEPGAVATFAESPLTLESGQTLRFGIDPMTTGTPLQAAAPLTLGGRLELAWALGAANPTVGFTQTLVAAPSLPGAFDEVIVPPVAGVSWATSVANGSFTIAAIEALPGDYNSDARVDAADYTVWRDSLDSSTSLLADGDGSGRVDAADYLIWRQAMLGSPAFSALPAPEPSPLAMAAILLAVATAARLRHVRLAESVNPA